MESALWGESLPTRWIDPDEVESPEDDRRTRGHATGAALFARGGGVHAGRGEIYFCRTDRPSLI